MTEAEALDKIMAVIREDLPEAETRLEIGKVIDQLSDEKFDKGYENATIAPRWE